MARSHTGHGAYPNSYYAPSAHTAPLRLAHEGDIAPEVCIVGAGGEVRPRVLILAGNAYLGHTVPELENRVMPF